MGPNNGGSFALIVGAYTALTFHRRSLSFISHHLRTDKILNTQQLGIAASLNALIFSVTKFAAWTYVNSIGAKWLLLLSIFVATISAFFIAFSTTAWTFLIIWGLAGLSHGSSWPPCGFFVRTLCSADSFGVWWGILSSASNLSALIGPIFTTFLIANYNWTWQTLYFVISVICFGFLIPSLKYLPNLYTFQGEIRDSKTTLSRSTWISLLTDFPFMFLCLAYVTLSTVKFSFSNWIHLCLIDSNVSSAIAIYYITFMEAGGLFGSLTSGVFADWLSKIFPAKGRSKIILIFFYSCLLFISVYWMLTLISQENASQTNILCHAFFTGIFIASCYSMYGMVPMEIKGSESAGRYSSVIDLAGSLGGLIAGYPVSLLQSYYGWIGVMIFLEVNVVITAAVLWIVLKLHSNEPSDIKKHD